MKDLNPSSILKEARKKAGLTQRELAKRADTSQSVVARIESGVTNPTVETLNHLISAAGFELQTELVIRPIEGSHMHADVARILQLSPEERLEEVTNINHLVAEAHRV